MAFTVNTDDIQEQQGLMVPGDYEVIIKEVKEGRSNSGTANIQIELVVRNDVNQQYKNKHLWYTIWDTQKTRESGMYAKQINTVSKHAGIQNGTTFNNFQDWGKFLSGRAVLATVRIEEYNGEKKERVSFISATKFPQCQHRWQDNGSQGAYSQPSGSYGQGNPSYNNGGNQQSSQGNSQNYNNGQQGGPSNQGYGNQNGGPTNQGNNGYYNNGQNVAGTGQAWNGNQPQNPVQQPQNDDDLPF